MPQFKPMVLQDETAPIRERAAATRSEALGKMEQQAVALLDAKTQSDADSQALDVQSWMEQRMAKGLAAVPGTAESWFFADGTQDQDKIASYLTESRERMAAIRPQFISAVAAEEWSQNQQRRFNEISTRLQGQANLHEAKAIRASAQELLDRYEANGDTAAYIRQVGLMQRGGVISAAKADTLVFQARKRSALDDLGAMMISDPDEAYDRLNNGQYDMYLSAAERARWLAKMREDKKLAKPKDIMDTYIDNPEAAKAEDKTPEFSGYFTAQECGWINAIAAGKGDDVKQEMEYAAIEEARAFDPKGDQEKFRADFMRKWNGQFGLDKDFCSRQLSLAEKRRGKLTSPQIDVKQRLDNMESGGVLRNEETWAKIQQNMPSVERIRRDYKALAGINDNDEDERVQEKYLTYRMKAHNKELRGRINEMYDAWLDTEEGEKATPHEQAEQLRSFARLVTGRENVGVGGVQDLEQNAIEGTQLQEKKHADWLRSRGKLVQYTPTVREEPYMNASMGFDSERKDLPAGVLLPKSMLGDAKQEDVVMEITYDNKHIRRFRVVGTTDGEQPVMTYAVARDGGYELDRVYHVAARLRHGKTDELMAPMDKPIGGSSVQGSLGITRDTPPPAAADKLGGLAPYRDAFIAAGNKYGIDPNFLMAISANETGWGSSRVFKQQNNAMGVYDASAGRSRTFNSVEESIDFMAGQLKKNYFDKGLTTIERIGNKYAPVGAANDPRGLNGGWVRGVTAAYGKLSGKSK